MYSQWVTCEVTFAAVVGDCSYIIHIELRYTHNTQTQTHRHLTADSQTCLASGHYKCSGNIRSIDCSNKTVRALLHHHFYGQASTAPLLVTQQMCELSQRNRDTGGFKRQHFSYNSMGFLKIKKRKKCILDNRVTCEKNK